MLKTNYHSHSLFCDGKSSMQEMLSAAIEKKFDLWGFSAHAPVPFDNTFAIKKENVSLYIAEYKRLKEEYKNKIKIFVGMEMDFICDIQENIYLQAKEYGLEYIIGSVHQIKEHNQCKETWFIDGHDSNVYDKGLLEIFDNDIKRACNAYFSQQIEMLQKNKIDLIAHPDKVTMHNKGRFFNNSTTWYRDMVISLLEEIKKHEVICEINTRGLYKKRHTDYYPSKDWWHIMKDMGIRMCLSSDCHKSDETDLLFDEAIEELKSCGYNTLMYFDG
ncbi:MAG: histidinol-phosphatase, partial [Bacteroidota bacterium]|nr:histidinol-phosphatase [Bacteroidota bacterium]